MVLYLYPIWELTHKDLIGETRYKWWCKWTTHPSVSRAYRGLLDFNFSCVIKMCWWPEKASSALISHIGLLHLFKTSRSCAVHTASCMTLIKVLSPLPHLLSFTTSQQLTPVCCSGGIWSQLFICSRCGFGYLPASFDWRRFWFSLCCSAGEPAGSPSSHPPLTCPSQQCALMLIGRKLIAWEDLTESSHRQSEIYLNRTCPEHESKQNSNLVCYHCFIIINTRPRAERLRTCLWRH